MAPARLEIAGVQGSRLLRSHPGVDLYRGDRDGRGVLVLLTNPRIDAARARGAMERLVAAHRDIRDDLLPAVLDHGEVGPGAYAVLDCDAEFDGDDVLRRLAERGASIPYASAIASLRTISRCLQCAHRCVEPSGRPMAFGPLSPARFLYDRSGRMWLLGPGFEDFLDGQPAVPMPPEIALGEGPSPGSDVVALATLMRVMAPFVQFPPRLGRVLRGVEEADDRPLAALVRTITARVWSLPPPLRPSLETADRALHRVFGLLGVRPDLHGYRRHLAALLNDPAPVAPGLPRWQRGRRTVEVDQTHHYAW